MEDKVWEGELNIWFETGLEGCVWALQDYNFITDEGFYSYDGLVPVKKNDYLKVYDKDELIWEGKIKPDYSIKVVGPFRVHWVQEGMDPVEWAKLFCELKSRDYLLKGVLTRKSRDNGRK